MASASPPHDTASFRPSSSYEDFRACSYFRSLDGLRALAVVAVVWHHTGARAFPESTILRNGDYGVQLFFAISGFLIASLLLREQDRHGHVRLRAFYARRALRIFPLYYAVLALYAVLVLTLERHTTAGAQFLDNLPYFLTYTSNFFVASDGRVIFYFAWSLAAEEQFYLLWPALLNRVPRRALMTGLIIVTALALLQQHASEPPLRLGLGATVLSRIATPISLGVLSAHCLHSPRGFSMISRVLGHARAAPVVGWTLIAALLHPAVPVYAVHVLLVLLVVSTVVRQDHGLSRLLEQPWLRALGAASYGVYLLHMLCANLMRQLLGATELQSPVLTFTLTLGLTWALATLSRHTFEAWFLARKVRFAEQRTTPSPIR